uniref:Alpha-1,3-mannosyl-glycoprotein 2-beta-N-acetylglucosaminyltransferase n=1 Tax=Angiostrongylus cantonensis TaxID=6313 RepID=A0A0K0D660_ANGCA
MKLAGKGSSGGLYKAFLSNIVVSSTPVDFSLLPYENMLKKNYDRKLQETLRNSQLVEFAAVNSTYFDPSRSYRVTFSSTKEWFILGQQFGIMVDIRGGMQRTAYYGIVSLMFKNCRIFLVPRDLNVTNFESYQYDPIRDFQLRYLEFAKVFCNSKMYTGICDPNSPEMIAWFVKKKWLKRLESYGKMIVN